MQSLNKAEKTFLAVTKLVDFHVTHNEIWDIHMDHWEFSSRHDFYHPYDHYILSCYQEKQLLGSVYTAIEAFYVSGGASDGENKKECC